MIHTRKSKVDNDPVPDKWTHKINNIDNLTGIMLIGFLICLTKALV